MSHLRAFSFLFTLGLALAATAADAPLADDLQRLDEAGISVVGPTGFEADVRELARGLDHLPHALRKIPGGRLELVLHPEPAPFGMGEWREGRFHLHAVDEPESETRAAFRLQKLTAEERRALWRRRALVHAVIARWDEVHRWSERRGWRAISGWSGGAPLNTYAWAFSRQAGMQSARMELLTFAEELLVPAESVHADAVPVDDQVRCQELTRARFLRAAFKELGAELSPRGDCPAFDAWADLSSLSGFELLFADPSSAHPESVFGHLLVRIVRNRPQPQAQQELIEVAAMSDPRDGPLTFVLKGAVGGYLTAFGKATMASIRPRYLEGDQRSLRRYALQLTADERVRLMERAWELERRGYLPYAFFTRNCASLLLFVLDPVLEGGAPTPRVPWLAPSEVLELLARIRREQVLSDGEKVELPLATLLPDRMRSDLDAALDADAFLERTRPPTPEWRAFFFEAGQRDVKRRAQAYRSLAALLPATADGDRAQVGALLDAQLRLERYAADRARALERRIDKARVTPHAGALPSADEVIAARRALYTSERSDRGRQELRRNIETELALEKAPRRAATAREEAALQEAREVQRAYSALAVALATARGNGLLPPAPLETETPPSDEWLRQQSLPAARGHGHLRLKVGAGVLTDGTELRPSLSLRFSALAEELGEQRDRGFSPKIDVRFLDAELIFDRYRGSLDLARADLELISFRTTAREPRMTQTGVGSSIGRGSGLRYRRRRGALVRDAVELHGELIAPLAGLDGSGGHLSALAFGAAATGRWGTKQGPFTIGPTLEWMQRVPFGRAALRMDAAYAASWFFAQPLEHRARLKVSTEHPVRVGSFALLLSPAVWMDVEHVPGRTFFEGAGGISAEPL